MSWYDAENTRFKPCVKALHKAKSNWIEPISDVYRFGHFQYLTFSHNVPECEMTPHYSFSSAKADFQQVLARVHSINNGLKFETRT